MQDASIFSTKRQRHAFEEAKMFLPLQGAISETDFLPERANKSCAPESIVVIPTYNERENIVSMIAALRSLDEPLDILVVDDNSPDGTADIVANLIEKHDGIYLLRRKEKLGLGTAYKAGFAFALRHGWQYICQMDADFSHDPNDVPHLIDQCRTGADVAIGSRYVKGGKIEGWPWKRWLLSRTANFVAQIMLRSRIKDLTGGFKCFQRKALEKINLERVSSEGYVFQVEMNHWARREGLKTSHIPICFTERRKGISKMGKDEALGGLKQLIHLMLSEINDKWRKNIRVFKGSFMRCKIAFRMIWVLSLLLMLSAMALSEISEEVGHSITYDVGSTNCEKMPGYAPYYSEIRWGEQGANIIVTDCGVIPAIGVVVQKTDWGPSGCDCCSVRENSTYLIFNFNDSIFTVSKTYGQQPHSLSSGGGIYSSMSEESDGLYSENPEAVHVWEYITISLKDTSPETLEAAEGETVEIEGEIYNMGWHTDYWNDCNCVDPDDDPHNGKLTTTSFGSVSVTLPSGSGDDDSGCGSCDNTNTGGSGGGGSGGGSGFTMGDGGGLSGGSGGGGSGKMGGFSTGSSDVSVDTTEDGSLGLMASVNHHASDKVEVNMDGVWQRAGERPGWSSSASYSTYTSGGDYICTKISIDVTDSIDNEYHYDITGAWTGATLGAAKAKAAYETEGGVPLKYKYVADGATTVSYNYDAANNRVTAVDPGGSVTKYIIYDGVDPTDDPRPKPSLIWAGTDTSDYNGGNPTGGRWVNLEVDSNGMVTKVENGDCSSCGGERNYEYVAANLNPKFGQDYDPDDPSTYTASHYLVKEISIPQTPNPVVLKSYAYDDKDRITSFRLGSHDGGAYVQVNESEYFDALPVHDPTSQGYKWEGTNIRIQRDYVNGTQYRAKVYFGPDNIGSTYSSDNQRLVKEWEFHDLQADGDLVGAVSETLYDYEKDANNNVTRSIITLPGGNKVIGLIGGSSDGYRVTKSYRENVAGNKTIVQAEYDYTKPYNRYVMSWSNNAAGGTTDYSYTGTNDLLSQQIDPDPNAIPYGSGRLTTNYNYDSSDRITQEIVSGNRDVTRKYYYDYAGNLLTQIDGFGSSDVAITVYHYNVYNEVTRVIDPEGNVRDREYSGGGAVTLEYAYEDSGCTKIVSATKYEFDDNGWLATKKVAYEDQPWEPTLSPTHWTDTVDWVDTLYQYDAYGRRTAVIADLGDQNLTTSYEYDNQSDVTKVTRPDGSSATTVRDGRGLVSMAINTANGNSSTTNFYYDLNGNLIKKKDPEGVCEYYEYDGFDRRIRSRRGR